VKKVSGFIGDVGFDTLAGGIVGGAAEVIGKSVCASPAKEIAKVVSKHTDKVVGKAAGEWAAKEIAKGGQKELYVAAARTTTKVMTKRSAAACIEAGKQIGRMGGKIVEMVGSGLITANEARTHLEHLDKGISYKYGCKVCEA
jgi:hypothetical protein